MWGHSVRKSFLILLLFIFSFIVLVSTLHRARFSQVNKRHLSSNRSKVSTTTFKCSMRGEQWLIITTIFHPISAIQKLMNMTSNWNIIVIGDRKTEKDWLKNSAINKLALIFLSIDDQKSLGFNIIQHLPEDSYARKNIGYLIAITCGAKIILEADSDQFFENSVIELIPKTATSHDIPWISFRRHRSPFINIYGSFGKTDVKPREFLDNELRDIQEDGWHSVRRNENEKINAYIQEYIGIHDLNINASYGPSRSATTGDTHFDHEQKPIAIEPFTFSPYSTKNTITHYEAFWGLLVPVRIMHHACSIWRGLWVQRLLWDINGRLVYGKATSEQFIGRHQLLDNIYQEHQVNKQLSSFARFLSNWSSTLPTIEQRIIKLVEDTVKAEYLHVKELEFVLAWLNDLRSINYHFPNITQAPVHEKRVKRAAVCVTGIIECVEEAWSSTFNEIQQRINDTVDTFLFLSSSGPDGPVPLAKRAKQARNYPNSTVAVFYEDRTVDPQIPKQCEYFFEPAFSVNVINKYYQQLWALSECYDLVRSYEKKMNIEYEYLIRARVDTVFVNIPTTLLPENRSTLIIPDEDHFGGYNDRFAIGSLLSMEKYMRRWHDMKLCYVQNLHAEHFLKSVLDKYLIPVRLDKNFRLAALPHNSNSCH